MRRNSLILTTFFGSICFITGYFFSTWINSQEIHTTVTKSLATQHQLEYEALSLKNKTFALKSLISIKEENDIDTHINARKQSLELDISQLENKFKNSTYVSEAIINDAKTLLQSISHNNTFKRDAKQHAPLN